jgi:hypothetical protein
MLVISITEANYREGYKIEFKFSDQTTKVIDFEPFLQKSRNPMTRKFLSLSEFKNFNLENGEVNWNDYELCFPIWDLHEGRI